MEGRVRAVRLHLRTFRSGFVCGASSIVMVFLFYFLLSSIPSDPRFYDPDEPVYWINQLQNEDPKRRLSATEVLAATKRNGPEVMTALINALNDPAPEVRGEHYQQL